MGRDGLVDLVAAQEGAALLLLILEGTGGKIEAGHRGVPGGIADPAGQLIRQSPDGGLIVGHLGVQVRAAAADLLPHLAAVFKGRQAAGGIVLPSQGVGLLEHALQVALQRQFVLRHAPGFAVHRDAESILLILGHGGAGEQLPGFLQGQAAQVDIVHVDAVEEGIRGHGLHPLAEGGIMAAVQAGDDEAPRHQQHDARDEQQEPQALAPARPAPLPAGGTSARAGIGGRVPGIFRLGRFAIGRILGIAGILRVAGGFSRRPALPGLSVIHGRASFPSKCGFGYSLL